MYKTIFIPSLGYEHSSHIQTKYSHMSKDNPIKKHQYKSSESGNPTGRPKGSLNRKTIALIHKAKKGDVNAYKALMDSAYGGVKQNVEITEAETPIFKQLDIDVIE